MHFRHFAAEVNFDVGCGFVRFDFCDHGSRFDDVSFRDGQRSQVNSLDTFVDRRNNKLSGL